MGSQSYPIVYANVDNEDLFVILKNRIKMLENVVEEQAMKEIYGY